MVKGSPELENAFENYVYCLTGKQHKDVIPKQALLRAIEKLELVQSDICGPINPHLIEATCISQPLLMTL
jgi:hypothetical protein